jgi:hypothetical protein
VPPGLATLSPPPSPGGGFAALTPALPSPGGGSRPRTATVASLSAAAAAAAGLRSGERGPLQVSGAGVGQAAGAFAKVQTLVFQGPVAKKR